MLKYVIRLDDACPTMNFEKWHRMEELLDKYGIMPIVGIIPNCKDKAFKYKENPNFWNHTAKNWIKKGWIIALHGYEHNLDEYIRTEFAGIPLIEQQEKIDKGINIMNGHGITPVCFFAPNHTFDDNTVLALKKHPEIKFISDGYAYYPYEEKGMIYLPSVFDTPHKIAKNGVFTFVFHPNEMLDKDFDYLEKFIKDNREEFYLELIDVLKDYKHRRKNTKDKFLQIAIYVYRKIKGTKR